MSEKNREEMGKKGRDFFMKNYEREMLLDRLEGWMQQLVS
jgi:hypothetical protein